MTKKKTVKKKVAKKKATKKRAVEKKKKNLTDRIRGLLNAEILPHLSPLGGVAKAIEATLMHRVQIIFMPTASGLFKKGPHALAVWQELQTRLPGHKRKVEFYHVFLFYAVQLVEESKALFAVAHELGHILLHYDKIVGSDKARHYIQMEGKRKSKETRSIFAARFTSTEETEANAFAQVITKEYFQPGGPALVLSLPKVSRERKKLPTISVAPIEYLREGEGTGTFPNVKLTELTQLASRAEAIIKKYGERRVEKVFEAQLALLIQSLGFYVVSTRTGYRTVDLICISDNPVQSITFLIEAKTTKSRYTLPSKDERALRDYVKDVEKHIAPLPAIKFVLIIGPEASKTMKGKLSALQTKLGVPVRFFPVQLLVALRRKIPGPVSGDQFSKAALSESVVLTDNFVETIALAYSRKHEALVNLVRISIG